MNSIHLPQPVLDVMADEVTPDTENGYDGVPLFPKNIYRGS
jgi:hypothetical protein